MFKFLATPKPPSITAAPEEILVDSSVSSTSNLPIIFVLPPTLRFFSIPTPPSTINAPLLKSELSLVELIFVIPSTSMYY